MPVLALDYLGKVGQLQTSSRHVQPMVLRRPCPDVAMTVAHLIYRLQCHATLIKGWTPLFSLNTK